MMVSLLSEYSTNHGRESTIHYNGFLVGLAEVVLLVSDYFEMAVLEMGILAEIEGVNSELFG